MIGKAGIERAFVTLAALLFVFAFAAAAQRGGASIVVRVEAPEKIPIVGAKVTVTNELTKRVSNLTTDAQGSSIVDSLAPGEYLVECAAKGFITQEKNVRVKPGKQAKVHTRLKSATPKPKSPWLK